MDLKDAYFHLPLGSELRKYMVLKVGDKFWEFQAGCFGLNIMPQLFMKVMGVLEKKWRKAGIICFVYLDDILVLGCSPAQVSKHLLIMVQDLCSSGFKINVPKSVLAPFQQIKHLGFLMDLKSGHLRICPQKLKSLKKELGKLVLKDQF